MVPKLKVCPNCNKMIPIDAGFCPNCGAVLNAQEETTEVDIPSYRQSSAVNQEEKQGKAKVLMIFGIIALVLSDLGIPGLIFSIIARGKAKNYKADYDEYEGMAKVGNILSKIALPFSIVFTVFWAIRLTLSFIEFLLNL